MGGEQIDSHGDEDIQQYQSKTSYIIDLDDKTEQVYNFALESIFVQHQEAMSSVVWGCKNDDKI